MAFLEVEDIASAPLSLWPVVAALMPLGIRISRNCGKENISSFWCRGSHDVLPIPHATGPPGTPGEATDRIPAAMAAATASGLNAALTPGGATRPFTGLAASTRPLARGRKQDNRHMPTGYLIKKQVREMFRVKGDDGKALLNGITAWVWACAGGDPRDVAIQPGVMAVQWRAGATVRL